MEQRQKFPKIVVTGLGVISGLGHDADTFWSNLTEGKTGIGPLTRLDPDDYTCKVACEVNDFDPKKYFEPKEVRRNDRYTQFAMGASKVAVADSGLDVEKVDKSRFGVVIGTGIGGIETFEEQGKKRLNSGTRRVSPFTVPMLISNMAAGVVGIEFGAMGPNYCIISACATASHALGDAMRIMRLGEADVMLVGGTEASLTPLAFAGFNNMKAMTTGRNDEPTKASRPFDAERDGFVMGEGAGVLVLETEEHAKARGAKIYCELAGHAATCDAYHITSPDPESKGLSLCINNALKDAGVEKEEIDYINAHGTSTPLNDKSETAAIKKVFGDHAYNLKVSSTKSMTGHLLGAAGAIEAIACIKSIETGVIAPTINLENPDPECDLDYVPNVKCEKEVNVAMSNNLGFGGHNASIIFRKYQ